MSLRGTQKYRVQSQKSGQAFTHSGGGWILCEIDLELSGGNVHIKKFQSVREIQLKFLHQFNHLELLIPAQPQCPSMHCTGEGGKRNNLDESRVIK